MKVMPAVAGTLLLVVAAPTSAKTLGACNFDTSSMVFEGSEIQQARCLMRKVLIRGKLGPKPETLGSVLEARVGKHVSVDRLKLETLLKAEKASDLIATLDKPLSVTSSGLPALYFVIHDTSQKIAGTNFPADDSININRLGFKYPDGTWVAHAFINRKGQSLIAMDFDTPWRATQLEGAAGTSSRGRFVHIENNQPRLNDPSTAKDDDNIAPENGLSTPQYRRLALLYILTSYRAKKWLIPGFHGVIDSGVGDHDDPQNFDRNAFETVLGELITNVEVAAAPPANTTAQGTSIRATIYYAALESDYPKGSDAAFTAKDSSILYQSSSVFLTKATIEGSARLLDGRTLTVDGIVNNLQRWRWTTKGYGEDAIGCPLVPFRTAAIDPTKIKMRTILFLPRTVGLKLPNGDAHDGVWYAADTGSMIKGDRIDLFVGAGMSAMNTIYSAGIGHMEPLTYEERGSFSGCPKS